MKKKDENNISICINRTAKKDYYLEEKIEAGVSLVGSEVKSIRQGKISINESYALFKKNEIYLIGAHVATYLPSGQFNHNPKRERKLLLKKKEILKLQGSLTRKGYTLIPVRCYLKNGRIKIELALARGKKKGDKRELLKEEIARREMRKAKR